MDIREHVTKFLASVLGVSPASSGWDLHARLVDDYGVDSAGIFELILWVEDRFALTIPPQDVRLEKFATIAAIESYVTGARALRSDAAREGT